ncbi:MAG: Holliday junction resolvase RuvX [Clostridia bacterium]|nr:Holliday junction resolvase RuvX [Clostridia bacterium]
MRILGIDFGDSRTGFAISDPLGFGATSLPACKEKNMVKVADYAAALVKEQNAETIVLGFPKNMNGSIGPRGEKTKAFQALLFERLGEDFPIILWDERLTTVSAHHLMNETNVRGQKRKDSVDSISAAYILQAYLDSKGGF